MHVRPDDGCALALLDHADQPRPKDARVLFSQHRAARVGFAAPQLTGFQAHKERRHGGIGPAGGEQRAARFVDGQIHLAVLEQSLVERAAEFARRFDGDEILHGDDGRHADRDELGAESQERVRRRAGGALAGSQHDQAQLHALPRQHADKFVVEHAPGVSFGVLHVERGLSALGAECAVSEQVQDVITFPQRLFQSLQRHGRVHEFHADFIRADAGQAIFKRLALERHIRLRQFVLGLQIVGIRDNDQHADGALFYFAAPRQRDGQVARERRVALGSQHRLAFLQQLPRQRVQLGGGSV